MNWRSSRAKRALKPSARSLRTAEKFWWKPKTRTTDRRAFSDMPNTIWFTSVYHGDGSCDILCWLSISRYVLNNPSSTRNKTVFIAIGRSKLVNQGTVLLILFTRFIFKPGYLKRHARKWDIGIPPLIYTINHRNQDISKEPSLWYTYDICRKRLRRWVLIDFAYDCAHWWIYI